MKSDKPVRPALFVELITMCHFLGIFTYLFVDVQAYEQNIDIFILRRLLSRLSPSSRKFFFFFFFFAWCFTQKLICKLLS